MASRGVLEVDTPALASAPVSDPNIECVAVRVRHGTGTRQLYLQSSPEYAMKRLLAAGSGPIYQLGKAFRDGEQGHLHAVEFTMLEWYRPGLDHHRLADECVALLAELTGVAVRSGSDYGTLFHSAVGVDPHSAADAELRERVRRHCAPSTVMLDAMSRADMLDLLFDRLVQPGLQGIVAVLDYPACQAALARLDAGPPPRAARFEVFIDTVEVGNGYHELADAHEQRQRMLHDLAERRRQDRPAVPLDERLLAALEAGIGDVAGVAVGFDRVVACALGAKRIDAVMAFGGAHA